jgi:hypothetical protein
VTDKVIDASAVVALLFNELTREEVARRLRGSSLRAALPDSRKSFLCRAAASNSRPFADSGTIRGHKVSPKATDGVWKAPIRG